VLQEAVRFILTAETWTAQSSRLDKIVSWRHPRLRGDDQVRRFPDTSARSSKTASVSGVIRTAYVREHPLRGNRLAIVFGPVGLFRRSHGACLFKEKYGYLFQKQRRDRLRQAVSSQAPRSTTCGRVFTSKTKPSDAGVRRSLDHRRDFDFYFFSSSLLGFKRCYRSIVNILV